ncbi:hypothetical protein U1Q18_022998 [Sarracenia purpurea var. burkii]
MVLYFWDIGRKENESMVIPLELLQRFKSSDFTDEEEFEAWRRINLKILVAGLLLHPHIPLDKFTHRLRHIIHAAVDRPIETVRNNELMQILSSAEMSLACLTCLTVGILIQCRASSLLVF